jgi:TonB family protein
MLETRATYGVIYADYPIKFETDEARRALLLNAAKGAAAEIDSELLENTEATIQGYPARELKEKLKNGAIMKVKMILVDQQRLYQVAVTLPAPDKMSTDEAAIFDAAAHQFLSSFKLTSTEQTLGEVDQWIKDNNGREPLYGTCLIKDCGSTEKGPEPTVIPNKASYPKPSYPPLARAAKASGTVKVQVIIDEEGHDIAAQAIEGHPLLYASSVAAAKSARFSPNKYKGQPAKVIGVLQYNFIAQ